jgi:hypothetical protein
MRGMKVIIVNKMYLTKQLIYFGDGKLSQYSVWLRAGRPDGRGSITGRGERIFPV